MLQQCRLALMELIINCISGSNLSRDSVDDLFWQRWTDVPALINKLNLNADGICTGEAVGDRTAIIEYVCILVRKLTNGPQSSWQPNSNQHRQVRMELRQRFYPNKNDLLSKGRSTKYRSNSNRQRRFKAHFALLLPAILTNFLTKPIRILLRLTFPIIQPLSTQRNHK